MREVETRSGAVSLWLRWAAVVAAGGVVLLAPPPAGVTVASWRLLAVFAATMAGLIAQPVPGGAVVLMGVCVLAATGTTTVELAMAGYGDPVVWLVLCAFFISRGMIKTGLGRRIALWFVFLIGRTSLGLAYALAISDGVLASIIPSNAARSGGIIFPITKSLAEAYDSRPGPSARRLGSFLMVLLYNTDVIVCAMFWTGQASNAMIAGFARSTVGVDLGYRAWLVGAIAPGLCSLILVPLVFYWLYPPEVRHTPAATEVARRELDALGPMHRSELVMLAVFGLVLSLWLTLQFHSIHYAVVALIGVCVLLVTRVLDWSDLISEKPAWDVFFWYGGLVQMAKLLGETGITKVFAEWTAGWISGWTWWASLAAILLVYFYAHYAFASITAHATAMFIPFLSVTVAAGAPPVITAMCLAYFSNLCATLTHFGTTPGPIYFGANYVPQGTWWRLGLIASWVNIPIWLGVGAIWWRVLGLW